MTNLIRLKDNMFAASGVNGLSTFEMDLANWQGIKRHETYHERSWISSMIAISDSKVIACIDRDICILNAPYFAK